MKSLNYFNFKQVYFFLIFFILFIYVYFFFNYSYLDTIPVYKYDHNLLSNKQIWKHVYGSIGSVASPIILYNHKHNLDSFSDFLDHFSLVKSLLDNYVLNLNTSIFFKSPIDSPEVDIIYQNYMNDMVNLQNEVKNFRFLINKHDIDLRIFNNMLRYIFDKYILYLNSSIKVLELDPTSSKAEVAELIKEINSLITKLNELKKL